jgi:hypothetical protein
MSHIGFQKSVRMFRKFSEETVRRRGTSGLGREGVAALIALQAVLEGQRLFDGTLLEPLAAFTNLLQSSQLPPEFGAWGFGDALLAIEEAHAQQRQAAEQLWEFCPELDAAGAAKLKGAWPPPSDAAPTLDREHGVKLRRFVLERVAERSPQLVLVCGALQAPELPLSELAAASARLILNDLDLERLEELVRRVIPEQHRSRVELERYDLTGTRLQLLAGVERALASAHTPETALHALEELLQSYDVGSSSAGLTTTPARPDLAISAMVLSGLGQGLAASVAAALSARGFSPTLPESAPLAPALALLGRLLEQHHVQALLARAASAVLVSEVSVVELRTLPNGKAQALGEPDDLLGVEHLAERVPAAVTPRAEQSWEWRRAVPGAPSTDTTLSLVEALAT